MSSRQLERLVLAQPLAFPEALFGGRQGDVASIYRTLAKLLHPDHGGNPIVFSHLAALHEAAEARIRAGQWVGDGLAMTLLAPDGLSQIRLPQPDRMWETGLGVAYLACQPTGAALALRFKSNKADHAATGIRLSQSISSRSRRSAELLPKVGHMLPRLTSTFDLHEGETVWNLASGFVGGCPIRIADLLAAEPSLPAPHAAWIISRLLDFCCFMEAVGLVHCGLHPENLYLEPARHDLAVLGGWEYAVEAGTRLAVWQDPRTIEAMSSSMRVSKVARGSLDLALVRRLAWLLAGSPTGLPTPEALSHYPPAVNRWLQAPPMTGGAVEHLRAWQAALDEGFGGRRFVPFPLTPPDLYNSLNLRKGP